MRRSLQTIGLLVAGLALLSLSVWLLRGKNCHEGWLVRNIQYGTICQR